MTSLAPASVAGYRLLEVIGVGERAAVYLAEPSDELSGEATPAPVVLKVCRGPSAQARVAECQVLLDHPVSGMPRLLDASRLPTGEQVIVMSFCSGRSLRGHSGSESRDALPGSWVHSFERMVEELHAAGVAHGGMSAGDVLIDHDGSVALVGFARTRSRGDEGFERAVATDRSAVRRLLAEFALEPPREPAGAEQARPPSERGFDQHFDEAAWSWRERDAEPIEAPEQTVAAVLEPAYLALVEGSRGITALAAAGARRMLRSRRRKLLAAAALALVGLAGALCVTLPPQDAVAGSGVTSSHASGPDPGQSASFAPPAPFASPQSTSPGTADDDVIRADDPVAAASALLRERDLCLRSQEPGCLEGVDEWNSPALRLDRAAAAGGVETAAAGGAGPAPVPVLVQRIGASAILSVSTGKGAAAPDTTKPASLLVVRGEAGWRIRSFDPG